MSLPFPKSMDECIYFTSRDLKDDDGTAIGEATAWVFRIACPKCKKGLMGKPIDEKTGKPKIRAKEYVCQECGHTEEKKEHEERLQANVQYVCPHCKHEGEKQVPFKRKNVKGVQTLRVKCDECDGNIDITKKMKQPKK
jgi:predicted RNA-binding Zn-ribbon protein involved in translation (DUF1610 family)